MIKAKRQCGRHIPNGHTTSNPRRRDITLIRRRPNFDEFPRHFCVLFRCNFYGRKIQVVSTYFFDIILLVEKSTLFPRTFFDVISMVEICTLFLLTFFDVILMGKDLTSLLVSCKLMKTFEKVFPVFVTLKELRNYNRKLFLCPP